MGRVKSASMLTVGSGGLQTTWFGRWAWFDQMMRVGDGRPGFWLLRSAGRDRIDCRKRLAAGTAVAVIAMGMLILPPALIPAASGATLPPCPVFARLPTKPVTADVVAAIKKYYTARHLTPITIYKNRETVLNVKQQSAGVHWCKNPDGSRSGYVGVVPRNATAAVMVRVRHKPYPVTQSAFTFATLAKMPRTGWRVVSDDTAP